MSRAAVSGAALVLIALYFADRIVFGLALRNPHAFDFMLSPWVAPALIAAGIAVLSGMAWLLLTSDEREG